MSLAGAAHGQEGGHELTSCQMGRCFSMSSGRSPKLSENISDKRMISSHPWSDNQAQGFFLLLFSREMFPKHNGRREVDSRTRRKPLGTCTSVPLGKSPLPWGLGREVGDSSQPAHCGTQLWGRLVALSYPFWGLNSTQQKYLIKQCC